MYTEIEDTLARELRQVAEGIDVPTLPDLPSDPPSRFAWAPLLVAAAVLVLVVGVLATVLSLDDDRRPQPAPSPTPTEAAERLTTDPPTVPYVLGDALYVGGRQVPGAWFHVDGTDTGWVGIRTDGSYWWGYDAQPNAIEGVLEQPPVVSPSGEYVGYVLDEDGQGMLTGFDTDPAGEGFGLGVELPVIMQGIYSRARRGHRRRRRDRRRCRLPGGLAAAGRWQRHPARRHRARAGRDRVDRRRAGRQRGCSTTPPTAPRARRTSQTSPRTGRW